MRNCVGANLLTRSADLPEMIPNDVSWCNDYIIVGIVTLNTVRKQV